MAKFRLRIKLLLELQQAHVSVSLLHQWKCSKLPVKPVFRSRQFGTKGFFLQFCLVIFIFRTAGRVGALSKMQGVYTGFCATLLRDIPFSMIYFPAYAVVRTVMAQSFLKPGEEPTFGKPTLSMRK